MEFKFLEKFLEGKKCIFCGSYSLYRLKDKRIKCGKCKKKYSLEKLKRDLEILKYFSLEISSSKIAKILNLSYNTISWRYQEFREKIVEFLDEDFKKLKGEIEIDEAYFGGQRKGNRGRGAAGKVIVLGILERNNRIYTTIVPDVKPETLLKKIQEKTEKGSVFYTDKFRSYHDLKLFGRHIKINKQKYLVHPKNHRTHINGVESFWAFAKERFMKYHGIKKNNFYLYLKELELRFNFRKVDIFKLLFRVNFGPKIN